MTEHLAMPPRGLTNTRECSRTDTTVRNARDEA
jgi:hypothetical protein